jgi:hypothetical protein
MAKRFLSFLTMLLAVCGSYALVACQLLTNHPGAVLVRTFHGRAYYRYADGTRLPAIAGATALAADKNVATRGQGDVRSYKLADNVKIYKGAIVVLDSSGYARPARNNSSDTIVAGIAIEQVDNTVTGHTAGGLNVRVRSGCHFDLVTASASQAHVGTAYYALDDQTVRSTATNQFAGIVTEYVSATEVWVFIPTPTPAMLASLSTPIQGIAAGYKIARGQLTTASAADTVVTGLATVVSVVAVLDADPTDDPEWVSATIGDQAGTPAAGSVIIKTWKNTGGTDPTPAAASTFSKKVNWVAIGT